MKASVGLFALAQLISFTLARNVYSELSDYKQAVRLIKRGKSSTERAQGYAIAGNRDLRSTASSKPLKKTASDNLSQNWPHYRVHTLQRQLSQEATSRPPAYLNEHPAQTGEAGPSDYPRSQRSPHQQQGQGASYRARLANYQVMGQVGNAGPVRPSHR